MNTPHPTDASPNRVETDTFTRKQIRTTTGNKVYEIQGRHNEPLEFIEINTSTHLSMTRNAIIAQKSGSWWLFYKMFGEAIQVIDTPPAHNREEARRKVHTLAQELLDYTPSSPSDP